LEAVVANESARWVEAKGERKNYSPAFTPQFKNRLKLYTISITKGAIRRRSELNKLSTSDWGRKRFEREEEAFVTLPPDALEWGGM
jgi:hypothetical protein